MKHATYSARPNRNSERPASPTFSDRNSRPKAHALAFSWRSIRALVIVTSLCASMIAGVIQPNWPALVRHSLGHDSANSIFRQVQAADYQYKTTVIGDSPTAYWPCDEGTGTTCSDASGNGHAATFACVYPSNCSSLPSWASSGLVAGTSTAVTCCGGSPTCCNVGANAGSPFGLPATRSVEGWYACSNPSQCGQPTLFDVNGTNEVKLGISGQNSIVAVSAGMGGNCGTSPATNLYDGLPHLLDLVDDGTHVLAYIDTVPCLGVTSANVADTGASCVRLIVRCDNAYSINPGERLGQVSVYGVGLSTTQLSNHYKAAGFWPGSVTNLVAKASTNSASLNWTPPTSPGISPITSYTITPVVDGLSSTPITVNGPGNGANIPNLPGGSSYTFQVVANNANYVGTTVTSNAVTIGSPSVGPGSFGTYLYIRSGQGNGQAFAHYGFVSRNNVGAMSAWTIEARLWGFQSMSVTGSHTAFGSLSGTPSNPTDSSPQAGLDFHLGGGTLQTLFVWPGGSCALPSDSSGMPSAFDSSVTSPVHVALSYDGATVRGFINGTQVCSLATTAAALTAAPFGLMDNDGLAQGYFDEMRVSGVARYTANFTPPTQQFTTDSNTGILWRFNDYPISKLPSTHILSRVGGPNYPITVVPSTYRDSSGNINHANTVWSSGWSSVIGNDDWYRPYSLGQGVTADELTGGSSPWLCPCTINSTAAPINDATGEFWHTFTDFHIPGRMALDFTRTYSSQRTATLGPTGYGWTDNYNQSLSFDGSGNATAHAGNGSAVIFAFTSPSTYTAAPSEHVTLVKNGDGTFTLTDTGKNQTIFNAAVANVSTLQKLVDRHGGAAYTLTLAYNGDGTLATVTDPAARTLTFTYQTIGSNKLVQSVSDSASPARTVAFQYGTNSGDPTTYLSLTQATDVAGGLTRFTYDSSHYLLTMTDPNGGITTNSYESGSHRISSQQDPIHRTTTFAYSNGITTITDPKGNMTQEEYVNGVLTSRTVGYGSTNAATNTYTYDVAALGKTAIIGPGGQTATATRDSNDNALSSTDGIGRTRTYTYNTFSETLTVTDPLGVTTTNTYTSTGDIKTVSRPLVGTSQTATTTYAYGDSAHPGDVTGIIDPDNNTWTYTYDTFGNRTSATDPLADKTTFAFDSVGRLTSMVTPNGNVTGGNPLAFTWTYTYDAFGNRTSVTDPLSHKAVYHYDPNQNLDQITDANGNLTTNVYDLDNELTQVKRADNPQTNLTTDYNSDGTVLDQKDGKGNSIVTFGYDSLSHVTTITDALNNVATYAYDAFANLLSLQDPGGNCAANPPAGCTTFTYDGANQLVATTYSDGSTPNVTYTTYDGDGQRIGLTDGTGTSTWTWDSLHRMVSYSNGNGAQVQWSYNLRNLPTTLTYPGSLNVTRGYDVAGRWTSVRDWNGNQTTFGYDADSNLTTETFPSASGVVDTSTFNAADRLTGITVAKVLPIFSANYSRDANNQLTGDTSAPAAMSSYRYTPLNQLCYAGVTNLASCTSPPPSSTSYGYDAGDNLTQAGSAQQAFNAADEICWTASTAGQCATPPSGATTYQYDTKGNRTGVTPSSGQAVNLAYDQASRLTRYAASSTTTYTYNADGLRMSKTSGNTNQFVWDVAGGLPLLLKDGSTNYIYGPSGLPLEQVTSSATSYYHHDQLGSTRVLTDSSGSSVATYTFDPYGNLVSTTGSIVNPFLFTGQYRDGESGLYYIRARYYDPNTGQFITDDPLVQSTRQPYGYVSDSPLNGTDPAGMASPGATCAQLLADMISAAKTGWNAAQAAERFGRAGDCVNEQGHWKKYDQAMNRLRDLYDKYLRKGCDPSLIPDWVIALLGGATPGPDDPEPWPSARWQWPVQPIRPIPDPPLGPPQPIFGGPTWPPITRPTWPPITLPGFPLPVFG